VLGFDFRNECSVFRTRHILFAFAIEEEEEETVDFFFMLPSRVLKEASFQGNKGTLRFKSKNISIFFLFFRRVTCV
jgi:hypothetical protein